MKIKLIKLNKFINLFSLKIFLSIAKFTSSKFEKPKIKAGVKWNK